MRRHGNPFLYKLIPIVINIMRQPYPEIETKEKEILFYIQKAEKDYQEVFNLRIPELKRHVEDTLTLRHQERIEKLGKICFEYRDTFGLTLETIILVMVKSGLPEGEHLAIRKEFHNHMEEQRNRSRASSKMTGDVFADSGVELDVPKTEFLGYKDMKAQARVLKVLSEGQRVRVVLDRTPFYAESGGQVGDTGFIDTDRARMRVEDTQKANDISVHSGVMEQGQFNEGDQAAAQVDADRRLAIMRNHTATHLLQAALREVLGTHIKQQGSLVAQERLRFDFAHPCAVKPEELQKIENRINQFIGNADEVKTEILPLEEAKQKGALAFFAEKYGNMVRVVSIGDYSREFCGGTHLSSTAQAEAIKIIGEGSVAQGIRRIEAVSGKANVARMARQKEQEELAKEQARRLKEMEKERQNQRFEQSKSQIDHIVQGAVNIKGITFISHVFKDVDMLLLRKLSDVLKQRLPSGVFVLGARTQQDASVVVSVTDDLVAKGVKANDIIGRIAPLFGASGGGRPHLAQAGSKEPQKLESALAQAKDMIAL
ncbi:MAG: hypothetical protein HY591_00195 [Candidatus Omnitrophica bacterium]|nr:hypothetical protein [Candidatus Omnitrophota bacterium]